MTVSERQEAAARMHAAGGNCAQAVAYALSDLVSDRIDEKTLFKVVEGFGLGMGGMEGTCGAVSGAVVIAGLMTSGGDPAKSTKKQTCQLSKEILRRFAEAHSSVRCKDLKGIETGKILCSCPVCIEDAVKIACEVLGVH